MALNQTQRDHAITMIEKAISGKKQQYAIKNRTEREFVIEHVKTAKIKTVSVDDIFDSIENDRWGGRNIQLLDIFAVRDVYEEECANNKQAYELATAGLCALAFDLKGQVMFGNDFSVVAEALEKIANFE